MNSTARVSVIMPAWNRANLVGESIEAMLRQTHAPHEVIVVDDGSTDGTDGVVAQFPGRVRLIRQANAGPGAARNAGLAQASGEFIQFFDSDDLCSHDKIERQLAALVKSGADVAYSAWLPAWLEDRTAHFDGVVWQQGPVRRPLLSAYLRGWLTLIPCCLIHRDVMLRVGGYPASRRTGEDMELLFRLILQGARFEHVPGPLVLLRQHPQTQISATPELAPMRVEDEIHLTRTVWQLLGGSPQRGALLDRHLWRTQMWSAERAQGASAGPLRDAVYAATRRVRQLNAGLRARLTGDRRAAFFAGAPMTASQADAVRSLGYEPAVRRAPVFLDLAEGRT